MKKLKYATVVCFTIFCTSFFTVLLFFQSSLTKNGYGEGRVFSNFGPSSPQDLSRYPPHWTLVDLKIGYLINNLVCRSTNGGGSDGGSRNEALYEGIFKERELNLIKADQIAEVAASKVIMLVLITSHAGDVETRHKIRSILPKSELLRIGLRRLFLLAVPQKRKNSGKYQYVSQEALESENKIHEDLLQGDFLESYRNLTYKHLMGLEWATRYCSEATFVLKQDDDTIIDFYQLVSNLLKRPEFWVPLVRRQNTIVGKVLASQKVERGADSKWYVSQNEISEKYYPAFVSGWAYITTSTVISNLLKGMSSSKYFWIDDVYVTGMLRDKAGIELIDFDSYFTIYKGQLQCCVASPKYLKSDDNRPYWCDFAVGPSNGDLELMEIFQNHSRFCHTSKLCVWREGAKSLNSTCVITNEMVVNSFSKGGKPKPRGIWESVRL